MKFIYLVFSLFICITSFSWALQTLSACTTISASDTYFLDPSGNFDSQGVTCINITANDVYLDFNGTTMYNSSNVTMIFITATNNVTLTNGTIQNTSGLHAYGINSTASNFTVTNMNFSNLAEYAIVTVNGLRDTTVTRNLLDNATGVFLHGFNITVAHNTICNENTTQKTITSTDVHKVIAIFIQNATDANVYNNTVYNYTTVSLRVGIYANFSQNVNFYDNTAYSCGIPLAIEDIYHDGGYTLVKCNCTVYNNTLYNTISGYSMWFGSVNNITVRNNYIYNTQQSYNTFELIHSRSHKMIIHDNIFENASTTNAIRLTSEGPPTGDYGDHKIFNNIFLNLRRQIIVINQAENASIYNNTLASFISASCAGDACPGRGIVLNLSKNIFVYNNIIVNNSYSRDVLCVWNSFGINLSSNTLEGNGGMYLNGVENSTIEYNNVTMLNYSKYAINIFNSSNLTVNYNNVSNGYNGFNVNESTAINLSNNIAFNNSNDGFHLFNYSENNSLTSNLAYNNTASGFALLSSDHNNLTNCISYDNGNAGVYVGYSNHSRFLNNTVENHSTNGGFTVFYSIFSNFTDNVAYNNTWGIAITGSYVGGNIHNNTLNFNSYGIYLSATNSTNITSNNAQNSTIYGFYLLSNSNNNTLSSNTAFNNSFGIVLSYANHTLLSNNDVYNSTSTDTNYGQIRLNDSYYCNLTGNNVSGGAINGISFLTSHENNISGGYIHSFSGRGIYLNYSQNNSFSSVVLYGLSHGLYSRNSSNASISHFNLTNITYDGFYLADYGNFTSFTNNSIANASVGISLSSESILTFSGNNYFYNISSTGAEINLSNATISTSSFNVSTANIEFSLGTTSNVLIQVVNMSGYGYGGSDSTIAYITVESVSSPKIVQSSSGKYYGLNVSNTSASSAFSPKMYYNSLDTTGYSTSFLGIGSVTAPGGLTWTYYVPTVLNTTESSVYRTGISSFSYFAPIIYNPVYATSSVMSTTGSSKLNPSVTIMQLCPDNLLEIAVTAGESSISMATVKLFLDNPFELVGTNSTNSDGKAYFTISRAGGYSVQVSASNMVGKDSAPFPFVLCDSVQDDEQLEDEKTKVKVTDVQPAPAEIVYAESSVIQEVKNESQTVSNKVIAKTTPNDLGNNLVAESKPLDLGLLFFGAVVLIGIAFYLIMNRRTSKN